ncbi:MAG TPA: sigma-70 family RNA polymerase sigma factor [Vicinamibacterales bacterium]|nr:sigma-70 family RNA polymerase sigma factor [Vicinamibacterales bacterium]
MLPDDRGAQTDTDVLLLQRLARRDASALGDLYDRHNRLLFGLIVRILGQRGEAEDVLQEVFMTAWTRAGTYNAALGTPVGWLVGIARNRSVDRLRANAARMRAVEAAPPLVLAGAGSPEAEALSGEQQRAVARALNGLPPDQRDLIEEAYFLGLTHSELAERHRLPLGTVKTRIRAGMLALRQLLSHSYIEQ